MQLNFPEVIAKISMFNLNLIIGGVIAALITERGTKKQEDSKESIEHEKLLSINKYLISAVLVGCFLLILGGLIISSPLLDLEELTLKELTSEGVPFEFVILTVALIIEIIVAIYLLGFLMWIMNKSIK